MSTEVKKIPRTLDEKLLTGVWRLTYKLINRMGPEGFGGRQLTSYTDSIAGVERHLFNEHGQMQTGYLIDKQTTIFRPEESRKDKNILDWLIGHPSVNVEQSHTKMTDAQMKIKNDNPRIKLVNLDYEEIVDLQEEDYVDKLVGRISLDTGKGNISLQSLRFILSKLEMQYLDLKYVKDKIVEKQRLRKALKSFVKRDYDSAKRVNAILSDLSSARYLYEIKEMVRLDVLHISNGMYKYETNPLGVSTESVIQYLKNNNDFYIEVTTIMYNKLKSQIDGL